MSVTLNIYTNFEVTMPEGDTYEGGSRTVAKTLTVAGDVHESRVTVADNYTEQVMWTTGDGGISTFDFLYCESDADILLNFKQAGAEYATVNVNANVPLILGSDDFLAVVLQGDAAPETLVAMALITAKNNVADAAGDAHVRLVLIT